MVLPLPNIFNGVSNQIINKLEKQQNQENMIPKKNHISLTTFVKNKSKYYCSNNFQTGSS